MALNINSNVYAGMLQAGAASLINIGSADLGFFHVGLTNSSKHRFSYVDAEVEVQELEGICSFTDLGDRELSYINLTLAELGTQQSACKSELYGTDYGTAQVGYLNQTVSPELVNEWGLIQIGKFSKAVERLRWSGDVGLSGTTAIFDGVIVQIQALGAYSASGNTTGYQRVPTSGTPIAVTASNVIEEIKKVINKLPFEVTSHADFKVLLAPGVAASLRSAIMLATGVNNLPQLSYDPATGKLTDNFFGYKVYVVNGLLEPQKPANNNIILAGIFVDAKHGVLKCAVNKPDDEKNIELKETGDGDYLRMRIATGCMVGVIPNGSQIAMNA